MGTFLMVIILAVFVNNFVVVQFLGICPFLGVSKNTGNAFGMGMAVTVVMTITCLITYPLYTYVLVPLKLEFLEIIVFIFVIAALVQMLEKFIKRFSPPLYKAMGLYLPLITTNCAVLGVAETVIGKLGMIKMVGSSGLGTSVLYGVAAGVGFTIAIVILSGLRTKVDALAPAKSLKGYPIVMVTACFMAMAFYVFNLISL
ncbi:MAG: electron transport complex subunit RsxA [Clostridia bacterium]|nr:electron transport complex subunit RsxA [Clostridia bacterium]